MDAWRERSIKIESSEQEECTTSDSTSAFRDLDNLSASAYLTVIAKNFLLKSGAKNETSDFEVSLASELVSGEKTGPGDSEDFSSGKATCTSRNPSAVSIDASNAVTMVTSSTQLCAPLTDPSSKSPYKGANMARTNQPVDTKSSGRSHLSTSVHVPVLANKKITTAKDYYKHDNVSVCSVASFVANGNQETTVIATYSASPVAAIVSDTFTNTKTVLQSSMMNVSEFPLSKQKENILTSCSTNKMAYAQPYLYCDRRSIPAQYTSMPLYRLSALCCQVDSCSTPSAVTADQTAILDFNSQSQQCSPNLVTNQPQKYAPNLVTNQSQKHAPNLVINQSQKHAPNLVTNQSQKYARNLVNNQSQKYAPNLVTNQSQKYAPNLVTNQTNNVSTSASKKMMDLSNTSLGKYPDNEYSHVRSFVDLATGRRITTSVVVHPCTIPNCTVARFISNSIGPDSSVYNEQIVQHLSALQQQQLGENTGGIHFHTKISTWTFDGFQPLGAWGTAALPGYYYGMSLDGRSLTSAMSSLPCSPNTSTNTSLNSDKVEFEPAQPHFDDDSASIDKEATYSLAELCKDLVAERPSLAETAVKREAGTEETSNGTVEKSSAEKVTRLKHFPMQVNIRLKHRKMNAEKRKKTLAFNASRTFSGMIYVHGKPITRHQLAVKYGLLKATVALEKVPIRSTRVLSLGNGYSW